MKKIPTKIILIPTRGRISRQTAWDNLPTEVKRFAYLVVHADEKAEHENRGRRCIVSPVQGNGMAALRQWMLDYCYDKGYKKVIFVDDDIKFSIRLKNLKRRVASPEEATQAFKWLWKTLDKYVHCALAERPAYFGTPAVELKGARGIQTVAYDVRKVKESGARFDKNVPSYFFFEDYHMTLQLFELGYPNLVSLLYRQNCGVANAPGGCSVFRNETTQTEGAKLLAKLHPAFVSTVEKTTKISYGGGTRLTVRVQWKQAMLAGLKNKSTQTTKKD